jgi:exopolyphosphatase/guanosine-5'-triphosphate,3'-diphosphate pyrophosphatase
MLHEVGAYINLTGNRRHSYYIISNSEIFGYTVHQRNMIAAIARYMGKSRPSIESRPLRPLSPAESAGVRKAVILLRLARALNFSRRRAVQDVTVSVRHHQVALRLKARRGGAELELWALEKERRYFREVFGRELLILAS